METAEMIEIPKTPINTAWILLQGVNAKYWELMEESPQRCPRIAYELATETMVKNYARPSRA